MLFLPMQRILLVGGRFEQAAFLDVGLGVDIGAAGRGKADDAGQGEASKSFPAVFYCGASWIVSLVAALSNGGEDRG